MTGTRPFAERFKTRAGMAVVLAAVALASVALYLPVTHYGFVWDDDTLITNNSLLAHSGPAEIFSRGFWAGSPEQVAGPGASYYRPLVALSFWLDLHVSHAHPHWFRLVNLILYSLAAAAVTLVLWELLHSGGLGPARRPAVCCPPVARQSGSVAAAFQNSFRCSKGRGAA